MYSTLIDSLVCGSNILEARNLETPFKSSQKRFVFSAEGILNAPKCNLQQKQTWIKEFYDELNKIYPTLWIVASKEELKLGATPGYKTLFVPDYRRLYLKAISSAIGVISFSLGPVISAIRSHVPALLLCTNEEYTKFSEENSISYMTWSNDLKPSSVVKAFLNLIKEDRPLEEKNKIVNNETLRFSAISDKKYLPFFIGLIENLLEVHGENIEAHLLCLDEFNDELKKSLSFINIHFYELSDIWNKEELEIILNRPTAYKAFSSKPQILLNVLRKTRKKAFFFDLDMFFYNSPIHIWNYASKDVLLFPQWSDRYEWFRTHGMYNSGMIAAKPTGENVINWWAKQCLQTISFDIKKGYFGDQTFLDLAPLYFDNIETYRNMDENIAPWNLRSLKINFNEKEKLFNGNGARINSYHAAGPDKLGIYELKYGWDQIASFFSHIPSELLNFHLNDLVLIQQSEHWKELSDIFKMKELITGRLHIKLKKLDFKNINSYVTGYKRPLVKLFFKLHNLYRKFRNVTPPNDPDEFWVNFQRKYLFEEKTIKFFNQLPGQHLNKVL